MAEYDRLTRQYQRSKKMPFRVFSEIPDHIELLGDLRGRSVLDLACGEGFYTRLIKKAGADRVVGVDLSENMIVLAREQEAASPLGITYVAGPAESLGSIGPFDVVSAAFLFNCAPDQPTLDAMARTIAMNLEPGGRMAMTISNVGEWPGTNYRPYGMVDDVREVLADGTAYRITFLLDEDTFTLVNFAHSRATYEAALREAGLADIRWHTPRITDEGLAAYPPGFWDAYLARPPMMRVSAVRPRA
jgi:2-polyprenyl-3-methyl-5-hydroxy-6-metoxy-1,4-benzoquinol methylase